MTRVMPPPPEQFDPVTARWLIPGGPLPDPHRDSVDPEHGQPVSLVDPIPQELAEPLGSRSGDDNRVAYARWRRLAVLILLVLVIAAVLIGGFW